MYENDSACRKPRNIPRFTEALLCELPFFTLLLGPLHVVSTNRQRRVSKDTVAYRPSKGQQRDQRPRMEDQGRHIEDQGPRIKDEQSITKG